MNYAVVTPTFAPHFKYIKNYLQSFDQYVLDKSEIKLVFVISENEEQMFNEVIQKYKSSCNIQILHFEDLLKDAGINYTADDLLSLYGKFSFQTIKKFLALQAIEERYTLVLDSESMWVRETEMKKLFEAYFQAPFVIYSDTTKLSLVGPVKNAVLNNNNLIFPEIGGKWFLETFDWFYDKVILSKMLGEKSVFEMVDLVHKRAADKDKPFGCFEIELYCSYLYLHREAFGYKFIESVELLKETLGKDFEKYLELYSGVFKGESGFWEQILVLQNGNATKIAALMSSLGISVVRCSFTTFKNIKYQSKIIEHLRPAIFAASQDHCFGVNNTLSKKFYLMFLKYNETARSGYFVILEILKPIRALYHWFKLFLKLGWLSVRLLKDVIFNIKLLM